MLRANKSQPIYISLTNICLFSLYPCPLLIWLSVIPGIKRLQTGGEDHSGECPFEKQQHLMSNNYLFHNWYHSFSVETQQKFFCFKLLLSFYCNSFFKFITFSTLFYIQFNFCLKFFSHFIFLFLYKKGIYLTLIYHFNSFILFGFMSQTLFYNPLEFMKISISFFTRNQFIFSIYSFVFLYFTKELEYFQQNLIKI